MQKYLGIWIQNIITTSILLTTFCILATWAQAPIISNPSNDSFQKGVIEVRGKASTSGTFGGAILELFQEERAPQTLRVFTEEINEDTLLDNFNTTKFKDGSRLLLRLTVFEKGASPKVFEATFTVDNKPAIFDGPIQINHLLFGNQIGEPTSSVALYGNVNEPVQVEEVIWRSGHASYLGNGYDWTRGENSFHPGSVISGKFKRVITYPTDHLGNPSGTWEYNILHIRVKDRAGHITESSSNPILRLENGASPFSNPSFQASVQPGADNLVSIHGKVWDFQDDFDRIEWRITNTNADWMPIADLTPAWHGYTWKFSLPVDNVLHTDIEVRAFDRSQAIYGPAVTTIQFSKTPVFDLGRPVVNIFGPDRILYQTDRTIRIVGTVSNLNDREAFRWDLYWGHYYGTTTWEPIVADSTKQIINEALATWRIPEERNRVILRLRASNTSGSVETFKTIFLNEVGFSDGDRDELEDSWEFETFGSLSETLNGDFDKDQMSTRDELALGFNPADSSSRLIPIAAVGPSSMELSWVNQGALGYEVLMKRNLDDGEWLNLANLEPGLEPIQKHTITIAPEAFSGYYQVIKHPDPLETLKTVELGGGIKMRFSRIPSGSFTMGSPEGEHISGPHEGPETGVVITEDFLLGKTEVTFEQFRWFLYDEGSQEGVELNDGSFFEEGELRDDANFTLFGTDYSKYEQQPMVGVSWHAAKNFCDWLTEKERIAGRLTTGYRFDLPTEAQWEYACRAGTTSRFHFNSESPSEHALTKSWRIEKGANVVGILLPNQWGLYDMYGNVKEWCRDWWKSNHPGGVVTDPTGPDEGMLRVLRGGSYNTSSKWIGSAARNRADPNLQLLDIGFRVALVKVTP